MFEENDAPRRTKTLGFAAISAAGLSLLCILIGQSASQFAELATRPSPDATLVAKAKAPAFNAIDYGATGSIVGQKGVISPCER